MRKYGENRIRHGAGVLDVLFGVGCGGGDSVKSLVKDADVPPLFLNGGISILSSAKAALEMPTALAPAIFASWPTSDPTGPLADATTTVSPRTGLPITREACIGGETGHTEYAKPRRDRCDGRIQLAQVRAIRQRVRAPSCRG